MVLSSTPALTPNKGEKMISCADCAEGMYPHDPRVKYGKYRLCGCDYCNKPSYYRELEALVKPDLNIPRPIYNITYKLDKASAIPVIKDLQKQITKLRGQLHLYFESRGKSYNQYEE